MARLGRAALLGVILGLIACGTPSTPTPAPSSPPPLQVGCFRPLDAVPGSGTPPVTEETADASARAYFAMNGATLARSTDQTGAPEPQPPFVAQFLTVRRSDYSSSGQGGAGGADPLQGRDVWLLGYSVEQVEPWSSFRAGATVYLLIDARSAFPILGCANRP